MALVGPRPEVPSWVARYTPEQRGVLAVRPGLTGPSQLAFRHEEALLRRAPDPDRAYAEEILPAKLALDLAYVRSRTPLGDVRLMVETLRLLVMGR
jgi:lipopolysaccharide/colanic/teichoic acid biosynthesis glycosyltransferase